MLCYKSKEIMTIFYNNNTSDDITVLSPNIHVEIHGKVSWDTVPILNLMFIYTDVRGNQFVASFDLW